MCLYKERNSMKFGLIVIIRSVRLFIIITIKVCKIFTLYPITKNVYTP